MEIRELVKKAHENAVEKGFYDDERFIVNKLRQNIRLNEKEIEIIQTAFKIQKIALIICEATEAIEALRKGDKIEHDEEIADILIRTGDYSGAAKVDLETETINKMLKNKNRTYKHGKEF
ncbi:hypothetical protein DW1_1133 [Proteiniborus sp. DW1]|uniref:hypothetical protein n=1 Tax=Proteiniborus sp. DW1 TaxID=1889883 RepID=UPI00092DF1CD|nr:hypothetical protein [Proteiniborus sp. DW1]SCG82706.1 hypothetical protein DW1_1133 [Proteiniborus sp. DW1]